MKKTTFPKSSFILSIILLMICGCHPANKKNTLVSIKKDKVYFNDKIINPGSPAEGLLMNVRMVNSVFEDRGEESSKLPANFDPMTNTNKFISKIPEYIASGVNAFTICLQGGMTAYEGAVNTAFNPDGSIREEYLQRVEMVIRACDSNNAAVILSCFYQRQHSHFSALTGKESIKKAVENTVLWIKEKEFTNVLLEISNEYRHGGFNNWTDGEWIRSEEGQVELMKIAKTLHPTLLVSTSGMGDGRFQESLALAADFILIHFNTTSLEEYEKRIEEVKLYAKPVICNEDDKIHELGANALATSVLNGVGWGFMHMRKNQHIPFEFDGTSDDPHVYNMMKNITTPGYVIDETAIKQPSVNIVNPGDGDIFKISESVNIRLMHSYPDPEKKYIYEIWADDIPIALLENGENRYRWRPDKPGIHLLEVLVKDVEGKELYRSPKVDIIVD